MPGKRQRLLLQEAPNCWEYMDCPADTRLGCPAYPDMGRECWKVTGTRCGRGAIEQRNHTEKILYCRGQCPFYQNHLLLTAPRRTLSGRGG
ncbi:MAG: hypothetical protein Kow0025_15330 [Thermodesulfovibrionales bacterium]